MATLYNDQTLMYALVIDYMNFQETKSAERSESRVPLAPETEPSSPISNVEREPPLCETEWRSFFNSDGRILNESRLRKAIFKGTHTNLLHRITQICFD